MSNLDQLFPCREALFEALYVGGYRMILDCAPIKTTSKTKKCYRKYIEKLTDELMMIHDKGRLNQKDLHDLSKPLAEAIEELGD